MRVEKTVFISYRRSNIYHARAVHQALTQRGYDTFLDFESIDSGSFERIILSQIDARAHFLLVLTPSALERCGDPNDWLRREIERAIAMQRNVVPLMFDNFDFAHVKQYLHGSLSVLPQYNGLSIPPDFFDEAMERLCQRFLNKPLDMVLHPAPPDHEAIVERKQATILNAPAPDQQQVTARQHMEAGITHYANGLFQQSIEAFSAAIEHDPALAEAYYRRGHARRFLAQKEQALSDWQAAVRLADEDDPYYELYASGVYRLQGQFDRALAEATTAIERNPTDPEMYKNRGDIYGDAGLYDEAIRDHTQAIRLNPQYAIGYNNRGLAHAMKGDHAAAIADYTEALRLHEQDVTYINRGLAYAMKGDHSAAIADYTAALRLREQDVTYVNRGLLYAQQGDFTTAIADYSAAIRLNPHNEVAYFNRGYAYGVLKNYNAAIADFNEVLRLNPQSAWAHYNRGAAYANMGDIDRARADYEAAVRIEPLEAHFRKYLDLLNRPRRGWLSNLFGG